MTVLLRHRATFDVQAVARALHLRTPRLESPPQWHWAWPLHYRDANTSPVVHNAWVSAVGATAVSDDATAAAFVSHDGCRVVLLCRSAAARCMHCAALTVPAELDPNCVASSVALFSLAEEPSAPSQSLIAVGYKSGSVAVFDVATAGLLGFTRPVVDLPVRSLRFYPAFHLLQAARAYPAPTPNAGLFAVLGCSGVLARLPATNLVALLAQARSLGSPAVDLRGAGWIVWHTSAQDLVLDTVVCGSDPSSICELDAPPCAAALRVAAGGMNPPIAAHTVTTEPAFSARDAAKRAASTVLSAARGFLFSRIAAAKERTMVHAEDDPKAVTSVARFRSSWADDGASSQSRISFGKSSTARKSVTAVLSRGRKPIDIAGVAATEKLCLSSKGAAGPAHAVRAEDLDTDRGNSAVLADGNFQVNMFMSQRSLFSGEEVTQATSLSKNARIAERIEAAPLPSSLLATCDTLGRIFVLDSRDLCVLRVLKGYRDGQMAWLGPGGPLLAVYAPRLNVLELHRPLEVGRIAAFRLPASSMLVSSTSHRVFCISPLGTVHELMKTREGLQGSPAVHASVPGHGGEKDCSIRDALDGLVHTNETSSLKQASDGRQNNVSNTVGADDEQVRAFLEAVKRGQISTAVECLQNVVDQVNKVAHLMATLVACTQCARIEMHIALSSKAAQIATISESMDLASRFEAHGRLAEAFGLLSAGTRPEDPAVEQNRLARYGHRLLEDELGADLAELAFDELAGHSSRAGGKRLRRSAKQEEIVSCERFILAHALEPTVDAPAEVDCVLSPRRDLSKSEQTWLARTYFARLLEVDPAAVPIAGREHPTTRDVFHALVDLVGLTEAEITRQFAVFFLRMPLLPLLNTHASLYASPIRCAIRRLRDRFARGVVDGILVAECERSSRIPNAVLLMRLFAAYEPLVSSKAQHATFIETLDRLGEVLLYRKLIAGSAVPRKEYEQFTARRCTGVPGDAERFAVATLIQWNDFDRATRVLVGSKVSRQSHEWHESVSVSEVVLHACRRKSRGFITDVSSKVIPENVVAWILAAEAGENQPEWERLLSENRGEAYRHVRTVLLNAYRYFPESSVDAIRCLQLTEAISALIKLDMAEVATVSREFVTTGAVLNALQIQGHTAALRYDPNVPTDYQGIPRERHGTSGTSIISTKRAVSQNSYDMGGVPTIPIASQETSDLDMGEAGYGDEHGDEHSDDDSNDCEFIGHGRSHLVMSGTSLLLGASRPHENN